MRNTWNTNYPDTHLTESQRQHFLKVEKKQEKDKWPTAHTSKALLMKGICVPESKSWLMISLRAHWPARTTPLPWISTSSLDGFDKASGLM